MAQTDNISEAGIVLDNEFDLKRHVALQGWSHFHATARILFLPGIVMLDDKIEFAHLLADAPYHPRTYCNKVPSSASEELNGWWIDKPARGSSGRGIRLVFNPQGWSKEGHVLQQYAREPLLFRNVFKFDLRVLALVTGDGYAYVYPDAVMRCSGKPYVPLPDVRHDAKMHYLPESYERIHLTNVCVQAKYDTSQSYVNILSDHPQLHTSLMPACEQMIVDVLCRWYTRVHTDTHGSLDTAGASQELRAKGFRIVGFDLLPMRDGTLKFIEANYQPGMAMDGPLGAFYARAMTNMLRCIVDPTWADQHLVRYCVVDVDAVSCARRLRMPVVVQSRLNPSRLAPDALVTACHTIMFKPADIVATQPSSVDMMNAITPGSSFNTRTHCCILFGTEQDLRLAVLKPLLAPRGRANGRRPGEELVYGSHGVSNTLAVYDTAESGRKGSRKTRLVLPFGQLQSSMTQRQGSWTSPGGSVTLTVTHDDSLVIQLQSAAAITTSVHLTSFVFTNRGDVAVNTNGMKVHVSESKTTITSIPDHDVAQLSASLASVLHDENLAAAPGEELCTIDSGVSVFVNSVCVATSLLRNSNFSTCPLLNVLLTYVTLGSVVQHTARAIMQAAAIESRQSASEELYSTTL